MFHTCKIALPILLFAVLSLQYLGALGKLGIPSNEGKKNLQKLMVEIYAYKTINHLNPPHVWDLFTKKVVEYDFRSKILCELSSTRSQRFGTNSLKFKGDLLWNQGCRGGGLSTLLKIMGDFGGQIEPPSLNIF